MRNVYLSQINHAYGKNVFLPYSVGLLQAYAQTIPEIRQSYSFKELFFLREDIETVLSRIETPDVFGLSCYIWNFRYSMALAKAVKTIYPNCLIVLGGPHVPVHPENFFQKYPYVDILIHCEGELAFSDILKERLTETPDYTKIHGLTVKSTNETSIQTPPRPRIEDLSVLPSPYLTGVFDAIMNLPFDFHASQETHRGCPYSCTFCDWGSNTMAKVKAFSDERLIAEFGWFGENKIEMLYNCDANYGLLKRDLELTVKMSEAKSEFGFPKKFRAAYAKNSNDGVFKIAEVLNRAGINKGITLSFQSMDETTLKNVERKNIQIQNFEALVRRYREHDIATYSELIIGLPGETYDSFTKGVDTLIRAGQHDSLQVYTCEVLPNSEMNSPAYREKYNVKTIESPMPFFHAEPIHDPHGEFYEIVASTATLTAEDWKRTQIFAWAVQCFHCLSLTQYLAVFIYTEYGISYKTFYETLIEFAKKNPKSLIGREFLRVQKIFDRVLDGKDWYMFDERFGNISWPPEEGSFLSLIAEKEHFYREAKKFFSYLVDETGCQIDEALKKDLLVYQKKMLIDPFAKREFSFPLHFNLHEYFKAAYVGTKIQLRQENVLAQISAEDSFSGDLIRYARDIIWYGRKGGKYRHSKINISAP